MTSNVGSQIIHELGGLRYEEMVERVMDALRSHFKPEFLNRIDETIIFHNLSQEQLGEIVDIQVERLARRLAEKNIDLVLSQSAKAFVAEKGYDPVYGARPLKRVIQKIIENELSLEILNGNIREGDRVSAERKGDRIVFKIA
jgi:ATP-dependent Clp protease ATP-binding subunit ClpB